MFGNCEAVIEVAVDSIRSMRRHCMLHFMRTGIREIAATDAKTVMGTADNENGSNLGHNQKIV